jgi:hypothetical protein
MLPPKTLVSFLIWSTFCSPLGGIPVLIMVIHHPLNAATTTIAGHCHRHCRQQQYLMVMILNQEFHRHDLGQLLCCQRLVQRLVPKPRNRYWERRNYWPHKHVPHTITLLPDPAPIMRVIENGAWSRVRIF